MNGLKGAIPVF